MSSINHLSTQEIRKHYTYDSEDKQHYESWGFDFDRWLAEHDREVKSQAIDDAIAYLKTTPAVTLTGKGGGYELLEAYRQDAK